MAENIAKESFHVKSPHVILSTKIFNKIKLNVIMLTDPRIEDTSRNRKVFYNIKYMSDNVVMHKKSKFYNVSTSSTKGNCIFILVALHKVIHLDNLVFFTEKGAMIPHLSLDETRRGYVLLGMIQVKKIW